MSKKMEGKVAVVIGSTSGIGKAMAEEFAQEGAIAIVSGRREKRGIQIVKDIVACGGKADYFKLDVTDTKSLEPFIDEVYNKYGKIDTWLYNAGIAPVADMQSTTEEVWDRTYLTNLRSSYFMLKKVFPILSQSKGNIVLTSALSATSAKTASHNFVYATCKAAISHMVRMLAIEGAPLGIRANGVSPGLVQTEILDGAPEATIAALTNDIPLHMIGMPEDIAKAALFLASDDAKFITGQIIGVDGGASIG